MFCQSSDILYQSYTWFKRSCAWGTNPRLWYSQPHKDALMCFPIPFPYFASRCFFVFPIWLLRGETNHENGAECGHVLYALKGISYCPKLMLFFSFDFLFHVLHIQETAREADVCLHKNCNWTSSQNGMVCTVLIIIRIHWTEVTYFCPVYSNDW